MKLRELVVFGACAFAGSAAVHMVFFGGDSTQAEGEADKGTVVKANRFELLDKGGKVRGHFSMGENGQPNLWLADNNGYDYVQLQDLTGMEPIGELRKAIKEVADRKELEADRVVVSHILISFAGAGVPGAKGSLQDAEKLTAEIYKRLNAGEDFETLRKQYTNDTGPKTYTMTSQSRKGMVAAFGDTGWRLKVNETGVAGYDNKKSPYGFHIIKRLE
ncbi:MAG: peptidylprolyl isomerase [Planctomycetaceae bacterium]|nr:peptidylprolyl isomerase [Planctomycetaceae bacterium]